MTSHFYENEKGDVILFEYIYMQQGLRVVPAQKMHMWFLFLSTDVRAYW